MHQLSELLDLIISAGPKIPEVMTHVSAGVGHFREGIDEFKQAATLITGNAAAERAVLPALDDDESKKVEEIVERCGRSGIFSDIFQFIKANPELLQLLLLFLKK